MQSGSHHRFEPLFARSLNLTDPNVLKTFLADHLRPFSGILAHFARGFYETKPRMILRSNCGLAFPMNPEILGYAMRLARGKICLEMGGAQGENAIFLASSGATKVYMNELESQEVVAFEEIRNNLPYPIRENIEAIQGDCLEILEQKPELQHKVGLVLCRNLIHFFNDSQQAKLFEELKLLLQPGGKVIFTANSKQIYPSRMFVPHPNTNAFTQVQCMITDLDRGRSPIAIPYFDLTPCSGETVSTENLTLRIYDRFIGKKWNVNQTAFHQVDKQHQKPIRDAVQQNKKLIESIKNGSVRVLITHVRLYSEENIRDLFEKNGFEVEFVHELGRDGHLAQEGERVQQIGVIAKLRS